MGMGMVEEPLLPLELKDDAVIEAEARMCKFMLLRLFKAELDAEIEWECLAKLVPTTFAISCFDKWTGEGDGDGDGDGDKQHRRLSMKCLMENMKLSRVTMSLSSARALFRRIQTRVDDYAAISRYEWV